MWTRILVPHDLSDCAGRALEVATELARRETSAITLLHVSPLPPNLPAGALVTAAGHGAHVPIGDLATTGARHDLEAIATLLREEGLEVACLAITASDDELAVEILRIAGETRADVIVMGTHGRTGLAHLLDGSVAEEVVRMASIPVVTVRTPGGATEPTSAEATAQDELAG